MCKVLLFFLLIVFVRAATSPDITEFNQALVKFDEPYLRFRTIYCSIPIDATGKVPCVMGSVFPFAEWKAAREAAKKFFRLEEKK